VQGILIYEKRDWGSIIQTKYFSLQGIQIVPVRDGWLCADGCYRQSTGAKRIGERFAKGIAFCDHGTQTAGECIAGRSCVHGSNLGSWKGERTELIDQDSSIDAERYDHCSNTLFKQYAGGRDGRCDVSGSRCGSGGWCLGNIS